MLTNLKEKMESYTEISDKTWEKIMQIATLKKVLKHECLCRFGDISKDLYFVVNGLLRAYILDEEGHEYNKNFFIENTFAASMVSLLTQEASNFEVEALEDSMVIAIDYAKFRALLLEADDLKLFQIYYLEQNWVIEKESREVALVQQNADERYKTFLEKYPNLEHRVPQYLIASNLGITPTQLSRIRKKLSDEGYPNKITKHFNPYNLT